MSSIPQSDDTRSRIERGILQGNTKNNAIVPFPSFCRSMQDLISMMSFRDGTALEISGKANQLKSYAYWMHDDHLIMSAIYETSPTGEERFLYVRYDGYVDGWPHASLTEVDPPYPLFNACQLLTRRHLPVVIVENEKLVAAQPRQIDRVFISYPQLIYAERLLDLSLLHGRDVSIEGSQPRFTREITDVLVNEISKAGANSVKVVFF